LNSAKTGENVDELFGNFALSILSRTQGIPYFTKLERSESSGWPKEFPSNESIARRASFSDWKLKKSQSSSCLVQ